MNMTGNLAYRNSYGFDEGILKELLNINCESKYFLSTVKTVLRKKSSSKLYVQKDKKVWHNGKYETYDFCCIPENHSSRNWFCLVLREENGMTSVVKGYLSPV